MDGMTVTEVFEPYFRQMGLPVLKIKKNGLEYEIETDRFLFNEVKDKGFPKSSFEYKWHVPLVVQDNAGNDRVIWLKNVGLNGGRRTIPTADITVINPYANTWVRINYDHEYIASLPDISSRLLPRNIAKMMQDHYQMMLSDYSSEYYGDIKTLFEFTKLYAGEDDYQKWIMFRELDFNNMFEDLDGVFVPFLVSLGDQGRDVLNEYQDYMTSLSRSMFDVVYPDMTLAQAYDIKKARMAPYITQLMLRYASNDFGIMRTFWNVALETVEGVHFLDQSPDTRPHTFIGAVLYESLNRAGDDPVTNYMIDYINNAVANGVSLNYVKRCTSQDSASGVNVPLYSGDCIENTYFLALSRARYDLREIILSKIHDDLKNELIINWAADPHQKISSLLYELTNNIHNKMSVNEYTRFITNSCRGISTSDHRDFFRFLNIQTGLYVSDPSHSSIETAFRDCYTVFDSNEDKLDMYLNDVTEFICRERDCSPLQKCVSASNFEYNNWRLPTSYEPQNYVVFLDIEGLKEEDKVDGDFYYTGTSRAYLKATEDLCHITMHVNTVDLLQIQAGTVRIGTGDDTIEVPTTHLRVDEYNYYHFIPELPIKAQSHIEIQTEFKVKLQENPTRGIYLSSYFDAATSEKKYLLGSHLESVGARRVFPCFDEPGWKINFDFTIRFKYPNEYTAIFNTQPISETIEGDYQTNIYHTTVPMPTYLLAFVISPYHTRSQAHSDYDTSVTILGRPSYNNELGNSYFGNQAEFALQEATSLVDAFSDFFDLDYCEDFIWQTPATDAIQGTEQERRKALCKSDQAGIPTFGPGAMENWGLILYREYYVFSNEKRDDNMVRRSTTRIVGHELIHQWWGNLVTCPWWDEIYINEAFGSIGGYLGMRFAKSNETYQYAWEDEYLATQGFQGLEYDGRNTSHPMVNRMNNGDLQVVTPAEIGIQFDRIAYNKAGSVMMMIRAVLGEDKWVEGLQNCLKNNKYKNVGYEILLDSYGLDHVEGTEKNIRQLFEPYFLQMGYPILFVNLNTDEMRIDISANRYLDSNDDPLTPESSFGYKWDVPFVFHVEGEEHIVWLQDVGGTGTTHTIDLAELGIVSLDDFVINPNANIWLRMHFSPNYVNHLTNIVWNDGINLKAGNIGRMMNDYHNFIIGTNDQFDVVGISDILDMTWLIHGPEENQFDLGHDRFIVWGELTRAFATFNRLLLGQYKDSTAADFVVPEYKQHMTNIMADYWTHYYPDKDPLQSNLDTSKARTAPYIANLGLALQIPEFLSASWDLIQPVFADDFDGSGSEFDENSTFDRKFYEFSPDTREATFQAAMLHNPEALRPIVIEALEQEVSYNPGLITKPMDGFDTFTCMSSYGLYDDCLTQKYLKILTFVPSVADAWDVLDELNGISSRFANTYIQELARRQWLRVDLVDTAQANQFKFGTVQLDGAQATTLGRTLCADAWTLFDAEQVSQWDTITVSINSSGAPDRRFNGAEVKSHCENRINTNRQYIDANYDSLRTWLCETYHENDTNCQMQMKPEW